MKVRKQRKQLAVPELVLGIAWKVEEGEGEASPKDRIFRVPLTGDPFAVAVRAHELAHVRFSPSDPRRVKREYLKNGGEPETLAVIEDARVNLLATAQQVDLRALINAGMLDEFESSIPAEGSSLDPASKLHFARAGIALLTFLQIYNHYKGEEEVKEKLYRLRDKVRDLFPVEVWSQILRIFSTLESGLSQFATSLKCAKALDALFKSDSDLSLSLQLSNLALGRLSRPGTYDREARWLPMRILQCPLPRVVQRMRMVRPADFGPFKFPHRIPPVGDGLVFGGRRRILLGGGILIDDSSSMNIAPQELVALVEAAPFSCIAKYSAEDEFGTLAILANKGRLASPEDITRDFGTGNGIDGPALRWLTKNARPPFVWVTDTYVTGEGDRFSETLLEECLEIVNRHKIKICYTVQEAVEYLRRLK